MKRKKQRKDNISSGYEKIILINGFNYNGAAWRILQVALAFPFLIQSTFLLLHNLISCRHFFVSVSHSNQISFSHRSSEHLLAYKLSVHIYWSLVREAFVIHSLFVFVYLPFFACWFCQECFTVYPKFIATYVKLLFMFRDLVTIAFNILLLYRLITRTKRTVFVWRADIIFFKLKRILFPSTWKFF